MMFIWTYSYDSFISPLPKLENEKIPVMTYKNNISDWILKTLDHFRSISEYCILQASNYMYLRTIFHQKSPKDVFSFYYFKVHHLLNFKRTKKTWLPTMDYSLWTLYSIYVYLTRYTLYIYKKIPYHKINTLQNFHFIECIWTLRNKLFKYTVTIISFRFRMSNNNDVVRYLM